MHAESGRFAPLRRTQCRTEHGPPRERSDRGGSPNYTSQARCRSLYLGWSLWIKERSARSSRCLRHPPQTNRWFLFLLIEMGESAALQRCITHPRRGSHSISGYLLASFGFQATTVDTGKTRLWRCASPHKEPSQPSHVSSGTDFSQTFCSLSAPN